ncbi:MAG: SMC-Scp complex subunit ScpB [Promethearchaeota archaeon]
MSEEENPDIEEPIEKSEEEEQLRESPPSEESIISEESQLNEITDENDPIEEIVEENSDSEIESSEVMEHQGELTTDDIDNIDALLDEVDGENPPEDEISISETIDNVDDNDNDDDDVKVISVKELTEKSIKRNTIEAALLAAQRPIGVEEISIKLEIKKAEIEKLIQELAEDYMDRSTAIEIVQIGEGFSMQIKPEYTEKITKFASGGLIPKAVMRTLTIIAVKQPLYKSLLVKMRGSTAYVHCKFLIDRGFVTAYKKGRSSILETTDQFADTFGLSRNVEMLRNQLIEQLDIKTAEEPPEGEESTETPQVEQSTEEIESQVEQPTEMTEADISHNTESDPAESEPAESEPAESEPAESEPVQLENEDTLEPEE